MIKRQRSGAIAAALTVASLAPAAFAADVVQPRATAPSQYLAPTPTSDWTITLGAEARVIPRYEGADSLKFWPFPVFRVRRAGTPEQFRSPRDGASIAILDAGPVKFGPTVKVRLGRKASDDSDLTGLGDVDWAFEAGAFAEYWPTQWLRTRAEVRQGFGGHHGVVSDITADVVVPVNSQLTLSAGPRLTWRAALLPARISALRRVSRSRPAYRFMTRAAACGPTAPARRRPMPGHRNGRVPSSSNMSA